MRYVALLMALVALVGVITSALSGNWAAMSWAGACSLLWVAIWFMEASRRIKEGRK